MNETEEALWRLHAAGRVAKPYHDGMLWLDNIDPEEPREERVGEFYAPGPAATGWWVLTDPCTRGGLLELLREASGDRFLTPALTRDSTYPPKFWLPLFINGFSQSTFDTDVEAIVGGLITLAEAL